MDSSPRQEMNVLKYASQLLEDVNRTPPIKDNQRSLQDFGEYVKRALSEDEAIKMIRPIFDKEIKDVLFSFPNGKTSGPNGFTLAFFKTAWNILGLPVDSKVSKAIRKEEWGRRKFFLFLTVLAHHKKNVTVKFDHVRLEHTITIYFNAVLVSLLKLVPILTVTPKPVDDGRTVERWKHVKGSADDGRVLQDAISRANGLKVPTGQYYLCDNSYMNCPRFLAPYRDVRYHLDEWTQGCHAPQDQNNGLTSGIPKLAMLLNIHGVDPAEAQVHEDHREFYNDDRPAEVEYVATFDPSNEWGIQQMAASESFTTSYRGRKSVVCRKMWTRPKEDVLIQALKEILTSGWKADNGFQVGYLNVLQDNEGTEPTVRAMRWKSWPYYDSWCEIFGKDRANDNGAENFHDAFVSVIHTETETQPQSPPATNLEDIDTPYTPLAEEVATTLVCDPGSSTTTKPASNG
ncbi:hypothetical protein BUALT_Bualt11G0072900 [Buddleja alternifolia]|uniref:Transposase n=1 Tax=Buddleja alternifolia TaxID=168488 RepID=A0AAV6WTL4_9LAMI|nr:hypothetical protein BUALT_Bualt11G0072900 [Buddleja alternifolia]